MEPERVISDLLNVFHDLANWAADYGWIAVLLIVAGDGVFPLFPGESAIIFAAVAASQGKLSLLSVILAGAIGAMIGDNIAYFIGRAGGDRIRHFLARLAGRERMLAAEGMVQRRGPALVFAGRFLPGIRIAINLSCGAGELAYRRFFLFDALGAIVWSAQAALLGFIFGQQFADRPWIGLLIALGVAGAIAFALAHQEKRSVRRALASSKERDA